MGFPATYGYHLYQIQEYTVLSPAFDAQESGSAVSGFAFRRFEMRKFFFFRLSKDPLQPASHESPSMKKHYEIDGNDMKLFFSRVCERTKYPKE